MAWYYVRTNSENHSSESESAHVELEGGLSHDEGRERVIEEYPEFDENLSDEDKYLASFTEVDWDFESSDFDSRRGLQEALVDAGGQSSLYAYSQGFGRVKRKT